MLQSATGIGSPIRIEVREDVGVAWIESWSTESTCRAWSNPKLDDMLDALGAVRKPRTVTTPEQLAALPEGTLFRSGDRLGRLWAHSASALDGGHVWADKHDALPLEVLA